MSRTSQAVRAVTDVALAALSSPPGGDCAQAVADELARVLDVDGVVLAEHDPAGQSSILWIGPAARADALPMRHLPTAVLAGMHPGVRYIVTHEPLEAVFTIADLVSERAFAGSEYADLSRARWGRNLQLCIPVMQGDGLLHYWTSSRDGRYFPADREIAESLRPLLLAITAHVLASRSGPASGAPADTITEREAVVLRLLAQGLTAFSIGRRLGISPRTVNKHLERSYRKLGVKDRVQAVQMSTALGLVEPHHWRTSG